LITPVLKALTVLDGDENWGDTADDFRIMVQADIGPKDDKGSETFTFYATSPKRLESMLYNNEIQIGRGLLIMNDFNVDDIEVVIERLIENCKRNTWNEVALALCRYSYWEYDN